jgi:hypothetical protein
MKEIVLTQGYVTIVDDSDFDLLNQFKWCALRTRNNVYAKRSSYVVDLMHRLITNVSDDYEVDHKNHDTLDNQRSNLRICTSSQNSANRLKSLKPTSSIYKGVTWDDYSTKWRARIMLHHAAVYLGSFDVEQDAAVAYNMAAVKLFGEFARLNEFG